MKKLIPSCIATTIVAGGLLLAPSMASATEEVPDSFGICTPADGWTETIDHPAVGEPTVVVDNPDYVAPTYVPAWVEKVPASYTPPIGTPTIDVEQDNPDYVPAVPESTEVIHHEAETKVVHHEAVTKYHEEVSHTEWKYTKNGGHGFVWLDNNAEHKVKIDGHWYQRTSHTRTVVDQAAWTETIKEAWDETVIVKEAWDETIVTPGVPAVGEPTIWVTIDNPDYVAPTYTPAHEVTHPAVYTPPVGKPTMVVDNPDYVAPWTETIDHDAVVCPPVEEPVDPKDEEPVVTPPVVDEPDATEPIAARVALSAQSTDDNTLAETGADPAVTIWGLTGAALAVAAGALLTVLGLRRRQVSSQQ